MFINLLDEKRFSINIVCSCIPHIAISSISFKKNEKIMAKKTTHSAPKAEDYFEMVQSGFEKPKKNRYSTLPAGPA